MTESFRIAERAATRCRFLPTARQLGVHVALWVSLLTSATAAAVDRVRYTPQHAASSTRTEEEPNEWIPQPLETLVGTIQSYDAHRLVIMPEGGESPITLPSDRILVVDAEWSDADAVAGLEAYRQGQYKPAIPLLLEAVKRRPAAWRQQWLSVRMAVAAFEAKRYSAGLELIAQLDRTELPAEMVGQLPIAWFGASRDPQLIAAAKGKLSAPEPLVRLTAASVLLGGANSAAAEATLQQLSREGDRPLVARSAAVLLWRQTPPPEINAALARWQQRIEVLPIAVRWGPMMVVADRLQAAGKSEEALPWWLGAGLLAPQEDHPLAAKARQRAAELLERLDLPTEGLQPATD